MIKDELQNALAAIDDLMCLVRDGRFYEDFDESNDRLAKADRGYAVIALFLKDFY